VHRHQRQAEQHLFFDHPGDRQPLGIAEQRRRDVELPHRRGPAQRRAHRAQGQGVLRIRG
jgi:hypothetical protein